MFVKYPSGQIGIEMCIRDRAFTIQSLSKKSLQILGNHVWFDLLTGIIILISYRFWLNIFFISEFLHLSVLSFTIHNANRIPLVR